MQSRLWSFVESCTNIGIGFVIALAAQLVIFPRYGIYISESYHLQITGLFTIVSIVRSYAVSRLFNRLHATFLPQSEDRPLAK